jgi:2-dehydropantoate 2-reductase
MTMWGVLGSGAIGSVFGGRLAAAGEEVLLIDVNRDHMDAVAANGLTLEAPSGETVVSHPRATADPSTVPPLDVVIVLTKGYSVDEAARSIAGSVHDGTWVITVQNGLGNDRRLAEVFGADRVVPGTTTVGGEYLAPGRVRMTPPAAARTAVTHLGTPRTTESVPEDLVAAADRMTAAGLPVELIADADTVIWTKLAMAASVAPLCTALRCTVADVWDSEDGRRLLREVFDEILAVAHAEGVALDPEQTWSHLAEVFSAVGPHHPSMTVDILNGRRTEIDTFSIEIAARGQALGVPTPLNRALGTMVKLLERSPGIVKP